MNRRYTPEMDAWLAERYPTAPAKGLIIEFEERFGKPISLSQIRDWANSRGIRKPKVEWSDAMIARFREFVPGHTESEIRETFEREFGAVLSESQIGNAKHRYGVKSGTCGGRFEKGHTPANKGRTWDEQGIPQKTRERMLSTAFKRGGEPVNGQRVPIGTERVGDGGYVQVKVKSMSDRPCANKCWRMKHHLVWEEANGEPVPPSTMIVFADGDKRNFDPENLVAVPRSIWATISHSRIPFNDRKSLEAAIGLAKLQSGIYKRSKAPRACGVCGNVFEPEQPRQRTCRACLDAGLRSPRGKRKKVKA